MAQRFEILTHTRNLVFLLQCIEKYCNFCSLVNPLPITFSYNLNTIAIYFLGTLQMHRNWIEFVDRLNHFSLDHFSVQSSDWFYLSVLSETWNLSNFKGSSIQLFYFVETGPATRVPTFKTVHKIMSQRRVVAKNNCILLGHLSETNNGSFKRIKQNKITVVIWILNKLSIWRVDLKLDFEWFGNRISPEYQTFLIKITQPIMR